MKRVVRGFKNDWGNLILSSHAHDNRVKQLNLGDRFVGMVIVRCLISFEKGLK